MKLELLTTAECQLCREAEAILARAAPGVEVVPVDIAEDDDLIDRYGERIPVLRDGERELGWPFGLLDVRGFVFGGDT
jgi:glutaredoxin